MAISSKLRNIYFGFFDGIETWVANRISDIQEIRYLKKYYPKTKIPQEYKREVKRFWNKYTHVSPKWAWYYASRNGNLDPRYIPNTLIYTKIDQYFNNRKIGYGFNDKNYYSLIFPDIKQPNVVARNIGGTLVDDSYQTISVNDIVAKIENVGSVICKPTLESGSGRSIIFWNIKNDKDSIYEYLNNSLNKDYIIQEIIKQHEGLNAVHKSSINSLRIVSILLDGEVYILSSNLRMGVGDSRIDNVTAGGISCGITNDGRLKEFATTYYTGEKIAVHPQGLIFKDYEIPSYSKAVELVKHAHSYIPHFRLVSWDIAIDENGDALLIEANMRKGGINLNQFNNGPLFGDLTEKVLDEVFKKK